LRAQNPYVTVKIFHRWEKFRFPLDFPRLFPSLFSTGWFLHENKAMDNKTQPIQNLQDSFLNQARRDRTTVAIYLMSGVKLTGRIRGFDKYSVILESGNQEQMIFKHAISTVSMLRGGGGPSGRHYDNSGESRTAESGGGNVSSGGHHDGSETR
jgi:host factor-I protein